MHTHELTTIAERTDFKQTGRIDEVEHLAAAFAARWPQWVRSIEYGRSAEGRPLRALLLSAHTLDAAELKKRAIPLLLLQAGIHPGESDGKDAGFIALRELLETGAQALEHIAVLFVPAFNTDGHERVGRWNRPNQVGPEETGWRTTAQNLNLNRDYMKAEAPEMRGMLALLDEFDPLICADLHVTDGANFEPDISIQVEPIHQGDPALFRSGIALRDGLLEHLKHQGSLPLPFYPDLYRTDDPSSGFVLTVYSPRFSTGYFPTRNRFTVLVETHSWKPYEQRVRTTLNTIRGLVALTLQHGTSWLAEVHEADRRACNAAGRELALDFAAGWREPTAGAPNARATDVGEVEVIDFRGYAYTRNESPISGEPVTVYDPTSPQIWRVPFRKNTAPSLWARAPSRGYVIPAGYAQEIGAKLRLHGIAVERFAETETATALLYVQAFRADEAAFSPSPFEGCMRAQLRGQWKSEQRAVPMGSLLVPVAQARSRLVMALLEPQAPDSLASWGFFNGCFEQKEYIEPYVAEQMAQQMLAQDSALGREFEQRLATDKTFAASAAHRREFFLRRHASWDERLNLYPIYRV